MLYSGSGMVTWVAWYFRNSDATPHPVCELMANDWGLCDMSGNVFEWTNDWYSTTYGGYGNGRAAVDPAGPTEGSGRAMRGGTWYLNENYLFLSYREGPSPYTRYFIIGFRLARTISPG